MKEKIRQLLGCFHRSTAPSGCVGVAVYSPHMDCTPFSLLLFVAITERALHRAGIKQRPGGDCIPKCVVATVTVQRGKETLRAVRAIQSMLKDLDQVQQSFIAFREETQWTAVLRNWPDAPADFEAVLDETSTPAAADWRDSFSRIALRRLKERQEKLNES